MKGESDDNGDPRFVFIGLHLSSTRSASSLIFMLLFPVWFVIHRVAGVRLNKFPSLRDGKLCDWRFRWNESVKRRRTLAVCRDYHHCGLDCGLAQGAVPVKGNNAQILHSASSNG